MQKILIQVEESFLLQLLNYGPSSDGKQEEEDIINNLILASGFADV